MADLANEYRAFCISPLSQPFVLNYVSLPPPTLLVNDLDHSFIHPRLDAPRTGAWYVMDNICLLNEQIALGFKALIFLNTVKLYYPI